MNKLFKKALALAAFAVCTVASAGVVTFDTTTPTVFFTGDTFSEGDVNMTVVGGFGAIANAGSCDIAVCPGGNSTNFFAGLNDGGLNLAIAGGSDIGIKSLDFSFIAPLAVPNLSDYGYLVLQGLFADGTMISAIQALNTADNQGALNFVHWDVTGVLSSAQFASVNIVACLFDGNGGCVNPADNQAQFALDNVTFVPEPATLALVGLGLFGVASTRRRQSV